MVDKLRLILSIAALITTASVLYYLVDDDVVVRIDNQRAIDRCVSEVEQGCPLLYQSVSELQEENRQLRQQVEMYRDLAGELEMDCILRPSLRPVDEEENIE